MPTLVSIAIPCPLRRHFDYLWPAELPPPRPGERVLVPFGHRRVVGLVLECPRQSRVPVSELKAVLERLDPEQPALGADLLALGRWLASYYHHPIGECLQLLLPVSLRRATLPGKSANPSWQVNERAVELAPLSTRAHQQRALLSAVALNRQLSRQQIRDLGYSSAVLNTLIKAGYLQPAPDLPPLPEASAPAELPLNLNDEQHLAVNAVAAELGQFQRFLLEGVTGSGKTEVYLQTIAQCLDRGGQALVLVPEIGLTPQTLARFERRFPSQVTTLHSGLSDSQRLHNWQAVARGDKSILLGTRSAVLAAFANLALIIVDEEHDASYKQQDGPYYSARDVAVKRAADWHCPVLLASATPSLDSLDNASAGRYRHLHLQQRAGGALSPDIVLSDVRDLPLEAGLSPLTLSRIDATLKAGNQALVFLNRRGFAPLLQCHSCGWVADCPACDARMTAHFSRRELRCHHCDARQPLPSHCPQCGNASLQMQGPGTERLELALRQRFADTPVLRIDRDTTSTKGSMQALVDRIRLGQPAILIGTQMLAKGHHFPDVTLVAVVDMDAGLLSPDFRAAERCGQLLLQVAGRAGRGDKPGQVLVQTHCPDHPGLNQLISQGYPAYARGLLAQRQLLGLPPHSFMAVLRCDARSLEQAEAFLSSVAASLRRSAGCEITGPLPAPMTRRAGRYRCSLLLRAPRRSSLHEALDMACQTAEQNRRGNLRWSVDVDPSELF